MRVHRTSAATNRSPARAQPERPDAFCPRICRRARPYCPIRASPCSCPRCKNRSGANHQTWLQPALIMADLREAYICDAVRTPIGRFSGVLAHTRTDDLAAVPLMALRTRNPEADWDALDEVTLGCANQAGEDNRNVARMALLLAEFPERVPGVTVNRLCASGLEAVGATARAIRTGEADFAIAGGVESMTRAPLVMAKG